MQTKTEHNYLGLDSDWSKELQKLETEYYHTDSDLQTLSHEAITAKFAATELLNGFTTPRNPRHFDTIGGGRKRVPYILIDKNSVSCI